MDNFITCGAYVKDDIENVIVCDPEIGDVIIQFDDLGDILLENVIVTDPRDTSGINLRGLIDHMQCDGAFGTSEGWWIINESEGIVYARFFKYSDMSTCVREVESSLNISYEAE